mgnify:CR=1 FL=1
MLSLSFALGISPGGQVSGTSAIMNLTSLILMFAFFYIFLIRPRQNRRQAYEAKELLLRQKSEEQAQVTKNKREIINRNHEFTDKYVKEIRNIEQYFKGIGISYRCNGKLKDFISTAVSNDNEILTDKHDIIKSIEILMCELRNDMKLGHVIHSNYQDAMSCHERVAGLVKQSGRKTLIKELEFDHDQIIKSYKELSSPLLEKERARFETLVDNFVKDMWILHDVAANKSLSVENKTFKNMETFENVNARQLVSLLTACASTTKLLVDIVVEDFGQTDACRLFLQLDEYEFISEDAKKLHATLKQLSLNTMKDKGVAYIFNAYKSLKGLMFMVEKSEQSLLNSQTSDIDVIHKDWNSYYAKLKRG